MMPGLVFLARGFVLGGQRRGPTVRVGSKTFTESVILGEIARELIAGRRSTRPFTVASWAARRSSSTPSRPTSSTSIPNTPGRSRARSWPGRISATRTRCARPWPSAASG